jgi:integrase
MFQTLVCNPVFSGDVIKFGLQANLAAERAVFALYQARRPENTRRAQRAALALFAEFMRSHNVATGELFAEPNAWQGITWGLVQGFQDWMLGNGYCVKTINDRVSVVKVYMNLAHQAGIIPDAEIIRLRGLRGFTCKESIDTDLKRARQGLATRRGTKKQRATHLSEEQARKLKNGQPDTPQGRRDTLLMCLLLDHGLRVSEVVSLAVENFELEKHQVTFYRTKTGRTSKHNLRGRAWQCLVEYLEHDQHSPTGPLLLASTKSGALVPGSGLTVRAANERVKVLGMSAGVEGLSPHDCRHYGATKAGHDSNVSLAALMAWGGWESPTSAARYIDRGQADNDGVSLGME